MRATVSCSSFMLVGLLACSRPQSEPAPAREPPAPSAQTLPSSTSTTSGSPGAPPPVAPNVTPPSAVAAKSAGPPRAGCDGLFDPPDGATKLCDEHALGERAEIHWTSWAVKTSRTETFRAYQQRAGACGAEATAKPSSLSVHKDGALLSIHDASESGYPSCSNKPGSGHASVIVISMKLDRR